MPAGAAARVAAVLRPELRLIECGAPLVDTFGEGNVTADTEPVLVFHVQVDGVQVDVCAKRAAIPDADDVIIGDKLVGIVHKE